MPLISQFFLGTGPGTINGPFEMENDYDSPSTSRDSATTNGIDRRGSLSNNRQSPTGENVFDIYFPKKLVKSEVFKINNKLAFLGKNI